jgi:hypothetical protein
MLRRHSVLLCAEVTRHVRRSKTCLKKVKKTWGEMKINNGIVKEHWGKNNEIIFNNNIL